jgi:hypothetical protein
MSLVSDGPALSHPVVQESADDRSALTPAG